MLVSIVQYTDNVLIVITRVVVIQNLEPLHGLSLLSENHYETSIPYFFIIVTTRQAVPMDNAKKHSYRKKRHFHYKKFGCFFIFTFL